MHSSRASAADSSRASAADIFRATSSYEAWLGRFLPIVRADLAEKHLLMRAAPFPFMRATFYRWCQLWREHAGDAARATRVLAVGDLHVENFGTWRDADGRLIWGINDFDEATSLPWTHDLVRVAVSAFLAIDGDHLKVKRRNACAAILEGYSDALACGGRPFVLEEEHGWLRKIATAELRDATVFWRRMSALRTVRRIDRGAAKEISAAMPARDLDLRFARRVAGLGSLGRPRFVGLASWGGGLVAREAKATAPSAVLWAAGAAPGALAYERIIDGAIRVPDPSVHVAGKWLLRRLAPHCTRIELSDLPTGSDEERLLHAMGFETANVHLGTHSARRSIVKELRARDRRWLSDVAAVLAREVVKDWNGWSKGR
jgi:uncharacterized protein (DUF2252 family)